MGTNRGKTGAGCPSGHYACGHDSPKTAADEQGFPRIPASVRSPDPVVSTGPRGRLEVGPRGRPKSAECQNSEGAMAAKTNFRGSFTALVTPFRNGSVDEKVFRDLVEWQITE